MGHQILICSNCEMLRISPLCDLNVILGVHELQHVQLMSAGHSVSGPSHQDQHRIDTYKLGVLLFMQMHVERYIRSYSIDKLINKHKRTHTHKQMKFIFVVVLPPLLHMYIYMHMYVPWINSAHTK